MGEKIWRFYGCLYYLGCIGLRCRRTGAIRFSFGTSLALIFWWRTGAVRGGLGTSMALVISRHLGSSGLGSGTVSQSGLKQHRGELSNRFYWLKDIKTSSLEIEKNISLNERKGSGMVHFLLSLKSTLEWPLVWLEQVWSGLPRGLGLTYIQHWCAGLVGFGRLLIL